MSKLLLALVTSVGFLAACGDSPDDPGTDPGAVDTVEVEGPTLDLRPGDSVQLTARAYDAGGQPLDGIAFTWSSDDLAVATVTDAGVLTAVGAGEVIIAADAGLVSGGLFVTVGEPAVARVEVEPGDGFTLSVGETLQLTATAYDADGQELAGRAVTWESHSPTVVAVSATGLVLPLASGAATITATIEGERTSVQASVLASSSHTLTALDGAALPTLLGRYTETIPDLGTFTRTLRLYDGWMVIDQETRTYEVLVSATMSTQNQPSSVPLVVRYASSGSIALDAATATFTFQPTSGDAFTGRWVDGAIEVVWRPEARLAAPSTFRFTLD